MLRLKWKKEVSIFGLQSSGRNQRKLKRAPTKENPSKGKNYQSLIPLSEEQKNRKKVLVPAFEESGSSECNILQLPSGNEKSS